MTYSTGDAMAEIERLIDEFSNTHNISMAAYSRTRAALATAVRECVKDAGRYRYLTRAVFPPGLHDGGPFIAGDCNTSGLFRRFTGEMAEKQIDAAMASASATKGGDAQ